MVEVTQARITQVDIVAAEAQAQKHYQTAYDYEMDLRQSYATHREDAAKAVKQSGWNEAMDHIANFINSIDSSDMTAKDVRTAIYSECLTAQPKADDLEKQP